MARELERGGRGGERGSGDCLLEIREMDRFEYSIRDDTGNGTRRRTREIQQIKMAI